jgi:low affinity Fe/Cu permease
MEKRTSAIGGTLERLSAAVTAWTGSSTAFACALGTIAAWAALGRVFNYSDAWQLVINTGTTIVTFLMVFLIQRSQNKDALAIHLKLNELVAALEGASNRLIDVEDLSEKELRTLHEHFSALARLASQESDIAQSHSVDEADRRHSAKARKTNKPRR